MSGAPRPEQVHLQFGPDASRDIVVSWASSVRVGRPRVRLGSSGGDLDSAVDAVERTYLDAATREAVWTYHAPISGLAPDTRYAYQVSNGTSGVLGGHFRTGPRGRSAPFRFTSFGDMGIPRPAGAGAGPWSPESGRVVGAVEQVDPLFHLLNGDLCYANLSDAPVETWARFFANVSRSAQFRPWMPCAGNHENELGNGPQGYLAYQTRFFLPDNGGPPDFVGNWYAFTVGAVRIVAIHGDDFCLQDGGFSAWRGQRMHPAASADSYVRGYSEGMQLAWLERTLATARADENIDWIIVQVHQVAMSSARFNGADLGVRQALLALFDRYDVDLVVAGHEHHYERSHPVRGVHAAGGLLTPKVAGRGEAGRVHLTMGVGGHPNPSRPDSFTDPPTGLVICDVGPHLRGEQRTVHRESEPAEWLAARATDHPYGFTIFDVDPGRPGGTTRIEVAHMGARGGSSRYKPVDRFTLERPRRDTGTVPSRHGRAAEDPSH